MGEFRSEERLMNEQVLFRDEKRAMLELRAEIETREKGGPEAHEASLRMQAMVRAEQARAESHVRDELMPQGPIRARALGSQGNNLAIGQDMGEYEAGVNPDEMMNGWVINTQREEKVPSEDLLNDEETENGDTGTQEDGRGAGEFDLNTG